MDSYVNLQRSHTPDPYASGRATPTQQQFYSPPVTSTPPPAQYTPSPPPAQYTPSPPPAQYTPSPPPAQYTPSPPPAQYTPSPMYSGYESYQQQKPAYYENFEDAASTSGTAVTAVTAGKFGSPDGGSRRGPGSGYEEPLMTGTDEQGYEYRHPEFGRVIPRPEILNRIVPFWELVITATALLAHHIFKGAEKTIRRNGQDVFLFGACKSENRQSDVDLCTMSIVFWTLTAGAIVYFTLATLAALVIAVEAKRHGYPALFTALWNSPWFIFCYLFREHKRIDLLSIPNRLMGFNFFTRIHFHRLVLALWALISTCLIVYGLTRRTVDHNDIDANRKFAASKQLYNVYNPYLIPYYLAIYLHVKAVVSSLFDIMASASNDRPELVAVNYTSLKR